MSAAGADAKQAGASRLDSGLGFDLQEHPWD
jgi:hypothetical protein